MPELAPRILHRDAHLLVLDKPSGLPTTSPDGIRCLASVARELDPDAPRMPASSRLDAEVTGVVTFARSDLGIAALRAARASGAYHRTYVGLAQQAPRPGSGEWCWSIGQDPRDRRRRVALAPGSAGALEARSRYEVVLALPQVVLLRLFPQTGRTHQLRVHAAAAGAPLLGDRHYGGAARVVLEDGRVIAARRVMLHCLRVVLPAIEGGAELRLESALHDDQRALYLALGGEPARLALL
jgi:23S rRNA-/tRNA-specific pseudouridylate synthase